MKVLLTGGTGSFGHAFTEVALGRGDSVTVFSRDEAKQEAMCRHFPGACYILGDVRDRDALSRAALGHDVIVHAAALKRVPAGEANPTEFVRTNVGGARNAIAAAQSAGVHKVLALSSDKAVNPATLYGATKMVMERLFTWADAATPGITFSCVRYGNVLGSRGSVVGLWREQMKSGAITVTDSTATRFWLTLAQGVAFVLSCLDSMRGGEVFVPKVPSSTIGELASAAAPGTSWDVIGLRVGEKLHEVLVGEDESPYVSELADRYVLRPGGVGGGVRFIYDSYGNPWRIGTEELRALLEGA